MNLQLFLCFYVFIVFKKYKRYSFHVGSDDFISIR